MDIQARPAFQNIEIKLETRDRHSASKRTWWPCRLGPVPPMREYEAILKQQFVIQTFWPWFCSQLRSSRLTTCPPLVAPKGDSRLRKIVAQPNGTIRHVTVFSMAIVILEHVMTSSSTSANTESIYIMTRCVSDTPESWQAKISKTGVYLILVVSRKRGTTEILELFSARKPEFVGYYLFRDA